LRSGEKVVLATVAKTWGSSPRPVGAVMVLTQGGQFYGSVSGGCIEEELLKRVQSEFPRHFETITYSSDTTRSLPCGGTLLLTLEPMDQIDGLNDFLRAAQRGNAVCRTIDLRTGATDWVIGQEKTRSEFDGEKLKVVFDAAWRLFVVGGGELSQFVCQLADWIGYKVIAGDPRPDYQKGWNLSNVGLSLEFPDDLIERHSCDDRSAVVALTHDPKVDDMAILGALETSAFYIGALGSQRTTASRNERLKQHFDLNEEQLKRVRAPIGLDLNTRRPREIALSVMTEIIAVRNEVEITTTRVKEFKKR
jgi:xanthine dehydrogenase accessory factor